VWSDGPWSAPASVRITETPTPPWSSPTNSCEKLPDGSWSWVRT
jgi:hypothetical protein